MVLASAYCLLILYWFGYCRKIADISTDSVSCRTTSTNSVTGLQTITLYTSIAYYNCEFT